MLHRPRRLRKNPVVREMIAETRISADMFMYPYFVVPGKNIVHPIDAMPGISHFSVDTLLKDVEEGLKLGINKVLLFGVGEEKCEDAHSAHSHDSVVFAAVKALKEKFKDDIYVATDVCTCAYTTHGHCGIMKDDYVQNDETVAVLAKMALSHAQAGADMVAPSDMMDGRIGAIRQLLDENGFVNTAIMSYSIKFASAYYGPFREAADSAPNKGDRKAYQMDFRNRREMMHEAELDEAEGADILMVKPALAYLDVIRDLRDNTNLPVACYNVSGEYSMIKAAAAKGWIDEQKVVMENMYAFARAGANIIITYHIKDMLSNKWI
ncbi:porphobilinogen synthase [Solitalea canadensis]|uniref:Delta-aminolevulinic acid dehydratase n=1 Tax=Solitalea canadensis (strain ATCC 29591 / DSM 3403 / JCM 21819 / LMG 8368 / NBRC 15130 / NCIMB 12057 / USAM 9D) TaxID=929556 RepID=H8KS48_SOLCM|nr:porphobilinogen synthase [Solitalea canadensis]AFD07836.1 delta-aminolevulinic acid dehydratase [Solitalea canadensis DSM 3403]